MAAPASSYPQTGSYAALLRWHLTVWGTRPDGDTQRGGKPWATKEFAFAVHGDSIDVQHAMRAVSNWLREDRAPPNNSVRIQQIEAVLFGNNAKFEGWRSDLRLARQQSSAKGRKRAGQDTLKSTQFMGEQASPCPRPTPTLVGRTDNINKLAQILVNAVGSSAILIQGGPGIGKTELTKAIAHHEDVAARFGERRWFIRLEAATTADALKDAVVRTLGCNPKHGFHAALRTLHGLPSLLILDNLETPWEPVSDRKPTEEALADLCGVPGVTLLASFRGRRLVGGPSWWPHALNELSADSARDLFIAIAGPWARNDRHLEPFLHALGGLPLALHLVALQAHGSARLEPLWDEWKRIGAELASDPDFVEGRLTSLSHSIELSLRSSFMTEPAWKLFRLLGQLPAGVDWNDLKVLLREDALEARIKLLQTGLATEQTGRVDMISPVREFARRCYVPRECDQIAWVGHFLGLLKQLGKDYDLDRDMLLIDRIKQEFANIESAVFHECNDYNTKSIEESIVSLVTICGFDMGTDAFSRAYSILPEIGSDEAKAWCFMGMGLTHYHNERHALAIRCLRDAMALFCSIEDHASGAECFITIGEIEFFAYGNFRKARLIFSMARRVFRNMDLHNSVQSCDNLIEMTRSWE